MRLIDADALINNIEELITEHEEMMRDSEEHPENYPEDYMTRVLNLIGGLIVAKVEVDCALTIDAEPVVHCRECRYFKKDWWHKRGGIIVAHEVCEFWGHGCKTEENSYCSYGERREP